MVLVFRKQGTDVIQALCDAVGSPRVQVHGASPEQRLELQLGGLVSMQVVQELEPVQEEQFAGHALQDPDWSKYLSGHTSKQVFSNMTPVRQDRQVSEVLVQVLHGSSQDTQV